MYSYEPAMYAGQIYDETSIKGQGRVVTLFANLLSLIAVGPNTIGGLEYFHVRKVAY